METKERIGTIREWLESFGDRAKKLEQEYWLCVALLDQLAVLKKLRPPEKQVLP